MGFIRKRIPDNVISMEEYKGRKRREKIDRAHNPSKPSNVSDAQPYDWAKSDPDLGYTGSIDSDPTPQHGTKRPTGRGKITVVLDSRMDPTWKDSINKTLSAPK